MLVMLHVFTVFSPIKVFTPAPPVKTSTLVKVSVAVPSLEVPLKPSVATEPVSVTVVLDAVVVKLLDNAPAVAAVI